MLYLYLQLQKLIQYADGGLLESSQRSTNAPVGGVGEDVRVYTQSSTIWRVHKVSSSIIWRVHKVMWNNQTITEIISSNRIVKLYHSFFISNVKS